MRGFQLAVLSIEQDNYMLCYDYYSAWINVYGEENVKVLTAKNLSKQLDFLSSLQSFF